MADILDSLSKKDLDTFQKDIGQIARVTEGISADFGRVNKKLDNYLKKYKKLISLFNKKYGRLCLRVKIRLDDVKLSIFLREEANVRDIFINVASRISGLRSIGSTEVGAADISNAEGFSNEAESIKDRVYVSYYSPETGSATLFLEYKGKEKMVELHYGLGTIADNKSPEFKLVAYYALKDGFKEDIDILSAGLGLGFLDFMTDTGKKEWLEKFNPKFGE